MRGWIAYSTPEDIHIKGYEILLWDGGSYHLDYVDVDPDTGHFYMANGTSAIMYKALKPPRPDSGLHYGNMENMPAVRGSETLDEAIGNAQRRLEQLPDEYELIIEITDAGTNCWIEDGIGHATTFPKGAPLACEIDALVEHAVNKCKEIDSTA